MNSSETKFSRISGVQPCSMYVSVYGGFFLLTDTNAVVYTFFCGLDRQDTALLHLEPTLTRTRQPDFILLVVKTVFCC